MVRGRILRPDCLVHRCRHLCSFQLCYDRRHGEQALTWTHDGGFSHHGIDDGEGNPAKNQTPILVADGAFPRDEILQLLVNEAEEIDAWIRELVVEKIGEYRTS
ncbi:MAG: hypothetical protein ACHQ4J_15650 [Candidatus Binatia bacterium]